MSRNNSTYNTIKHIKMNEQLELIIGIDFGHGEVAASYIDLVRGNGEPQFLNLNANPVNIKSEAVAPSLIYKIRNNEIYSYSIDIQGGIEIDLKGRINNEHERLNAYSEFISQIFQRLKNNNHEILSDNGRLKNFQLYIAAPTRWTAIEKENYKNFIEEALGNEVEWIISESDAAFYCYNVAGNSVVLVIDYGSSTIDYTLMMDNRKIDIDHHANNLGASNVERVIFNNYRNNNNNDYNIKEQLTRQALVHENLNFITPDNHIEFELRKQKERYYIADPKPDLFRCDINVAFRVTGNNRYQNNDYMFSYNTPEVDRIIEPYENRVEENLKNLKTEIDNKLRGRKLDRIILTGGASRMNWFRGKVATVFSNVGKENIIHDNSGASHSVSDGIVKYAVAQKRCLDDIIAGIEEFRNNGTYLEVYKEARKAAVQSMIGDPLGEICNEYANLDRNAPVRELFDSVRKCFNNIFQTEEYREDLNRKMKEELIRRFTPKISDILKERLGIDNVAIDNDNLINRINNVRVQEVANSIPGLIENNISAMINRCRWRVDPDKERKKDKRRIYADEIINKFMNGDEYFKLTDNDKQCINNQILIFEGLAMACAKEIFYSNELFRTQFLG